MTPSVRITRGAAWAGSIGTAPSSEAPRPGGQSSRWNEMVSGLDTQVRADLL